MPKRPLLPERNASSEFDQSRRLLGGFSTRPGGRAWCRGPNTLHPYHLHRFWKLCGSEQVLCWGKWTLSIEKTSERSHEDQRYRFLGCSRFAPVLIWTRVAKI